MVEDSPPYLFGRLYVCGRQKCLKCGILLVSDLQSTFLSRFLSYLAGGLVC